MRVFATVASLETLKRIKKMNKIDTSTTAGKIAVMQAFEGGKQIEFNDSDGCGWCEMLSNEEPAWHWVACRYRIKPQTVEEAAKDHAIYKYNNTLTMSSDRHDSFIVGAKWQKEQSK